MDFYQFVNSPDVQKHLRKIRYEFSPAEAAWLVYMSRSATLKEKHAAWQTIIDTMPDDRIETELDETPTGLHAYLREYMKKQNELCRAFLGAAKPSDLFLRIRSGFEEYGKLTGNTTLSDTIERSRQEVSEDDGTVYQVRVRDKKSGRWYDRDGVYSTCADCLTAVASVKSIDRIRIRRQSLCDASVDIVAELRPDGELLSVEENRPTRAYSILCDGFETTCYTFPAPFQKGDIIYDPEEREICGGPFVLYETGDFPRGYFQDGDSGELYSDSMFCYENCEYYRGDLSGKRRVLTAMSNFLKGKIDVCLFARAYHQILLEEAAKENRHKRKG